MVLKDTKNKDTIIATLMMFQMKLQYIQKLETRKLHYSTKVNQSYSRPGQAFRVPGS
jgi:hypothetical protein